ncbi:hypothetical protein QCA50_008666 [Cerrena zonata]|uniref:BTB domain-containing protein n=1 Tax=Cerrena zonata TaxID=2478898 RepID=A0AAW0GAW8_9APHY
MDMNETPNEASVVAKLNPNHDTNSGLKPSIAKSPFDNEDGDADLILRTSDKVEFYVHKLFLRKASPIFADMFTVARSELSIHVDGPSQTPYLPIVEVEEPSFIIDSLLRIYYPVEEVGQTSLNRVVDVFQAALKYEMHKAATRMRKEFATYARTDALSVYAYACTLNLENEAKLGAEEWRKQCEPRFFFFSSSKFADCIAGKTYRHEMQDNTAGHLYRLIRFVKSGVYTPFCSPPPPLQESSTGCEASNIEDQSNIYPFTRFPNPDIIIRSIDNIDFPAHTSILTYASNSTSKILHLPKDQNPDGLQSVICVTEDSKTIATVLQLCYPFAQYEVSEDTCTVSHIAGVRKTAEKYGIVNAARLACDVMEDLIEKHAIQVYFAARRYGWEREAKLAEAQCWTLSDIEGPGAYVAEMEFVSADVYHHLLERWYEAKSLISTPSLSLSSSGAMKPRQKRRRR